MGKNYFILFDTNGQNPLHRGKGTYINILIYVLIAHVILKHTLKFQPILIMIISHYDHHSDVNIPGFFFFFFLFQFCDVAKIGDHPQEDLAKSGYRPTIYESKII